MFLQRPDRLLIFVCAAAVFAYSALPAWSQTSSPETNQPAGSGQLSVGIVVDNSGSYRTIFDRVLNSTTSMIDDLRSGDEGFLVTFVDSPKIALRQDMTRDKGELKDAVDEMFIQGGPTAILDAVVFSAKYMAEHAQDGPERSRVLLLITDGDERQSSASLEEAVKAAKDARLRIFVLGLFEEKFYPKVVDRLVKETGGARFVPKIPKDTQNAVTSLLAAMRAN